MGLDMYLNAKRYIFNIEEGVGDKVAEAINVPYGRVKGITAEAMYWRKANHIHAWFVKYVQDGEDDCGEYDVGIEHLTKLLHDCRAVLADRSKAMELLPPQEGFFFGNTDLNESYFNWIQHTADKLEEILQVDMKEWYFTYQSSW